MNGLGRRSLALKLRKTTTLSIRQIAVKVNANKTTVGGWLRGVRPGQGTRDTGQGTRGQSPSLVPSVQVSPVQDKGQSLSSHGQTDKKKKSKVVQDTLDEATEIAKPTVKKVKPKKPKSIYVPATIEKIDPEPIPQSDPEETQEISDLDPKKKSSGLMIWVFLAVILFIAVYYLVKWWSERSQQISGVAEQDYKPPTPTNPDGRDGEIDFTEGL